MSDINLDQPTTPRDKSGRSQAERRQAQLLSELSKGVDLQHHNSSLLHEFGGAFEAPSAVTTDSSGVGTVGQAPSPARADHQHGAEVPTFIYPALINGWGNYGAGWTPPRYYKMNGRVWIEGLAANGTLGSAVFYLDAVYRPLMNLMWASVAANAFTRLNVYPDGFVGVEAAMGTNIFVSLNCSFYPGA